jgi:hypothetical protein
VSELDVIVSHFRAEQAAEYERLLAERELPRWHEAWNSPAVIRESTSGGLNMPQRRPPRAYHGLSCRRTG